MFTMPSPGVSPLASIERESARAPLLPCATSIALTGDARMALKEQIVEYQEGSTRLHGFFCYDDSYPGRVPAVLISHTWCGRDPFVERKARRLAWHGYAAFALDMYGEGKCGKTVEENSALMAPFMQDRALLARRMNAALTTVKSQPSVDPQRVAA